MVTKINDLEYMESIYNQKHNISDIIARLEFPQKYLTLEYEGELYNLDIVSVDDYEFILRVVNKKEELDVDG